MGKLNSAVANMTEEDPTFDLTAKKKKTPFDLDAALEGATENNVEEEKKEEDDAEDTKKEKKVGFTEDKNDNIDDIDLESFGTKKKKKKKREGLDMEDIKSALPDDENKENDVAMIDEDLDLNDFG